jgi:hypothetical protein
VASAHVTGQAGASFPRWTSENRPYADTSNPTNGAEPEQEHLYPAEHSRGKFILCMVGRETFSMLFHRAAAGVSYCEMRPRKCSVRKMPRNTRPAINNKTQARADQALLNLLVISESIFVRSARVVVDGHGLAHPGFCLLRGLPAGVLVPIYLKRVAVSIVIARLVRHNLANGGCLPRSNVAVMPRCDKHKRGAQ